jgi:hypothetical protein
VWHGRRALTTRRAKTHHSDTLCKECETRKSGEGNGDGEITFGDEHVGHEADNGDKERNDIPEEGHCKLEPLGLESNSNLKPTCSTANLVRTDFAEPLHFTSSRLHDAVYPF